jgi:phage/plasmid-associated DNA primase
MKWEGCAACMGWGRGGKGMIIQILEKLRGKYHMANLDANLRVTVEWIILKYWMYPNWI